MVNSSSIRTFTSHLDKNWDFFHVDSPGLCQFLESSWEPQWGLVTPQQRTSPHPPSREIFLLATCHQKPDLRAHLAPSPRISCTLPPLSLWFWCLLPCPTKPHPHCCSLQQPQLGLLLHGTPLHQLNAQTGPCVGSSHLLRAGLLMQAANLFISCSTVRPQI